MSLYQIVVPEATTNLITNPSAETVATGYTAIAGTVARSTAQSKFGAAAINVTPTSAAFDGMYYAVTLAAATVHTWTFWTLGPAAGIPMRAYVHDVTAGVTIGSVVTFTGSASWQEVTVTFTTSANTSFRLYVTKNNHATTSNYYVDAMQLETKDYATTFVQVEDPPQPGFAWSGARHASTSSRTAQTRAGGRVRDLTDYNAYLELHTGGGMVPTEHVSSPYGLLPGSVYQRTRVLPRVLLLTFGLVGTTLSDFHTQRRNLLSLFEPYGANGEPTIIRYTGGSEPLELSVYYDGGLDGGDVLAFEETATLRLVAPDPFWRRLGNKSLTLTATGNLADADYIVERDSNGIWRALGGGLNGQVNVAVYNPVDKMLYVGGSFTTAYNAAGTGSPVTVNNIAKWDGTQWVALGSGVKYSGVGEAVWALSFSPDGTIVYVGGVFDTVNGTAIAASFLAQWNGTTWSVVGSAGAGTGVVNTLATGTDGRVYIGGAFLNWNANANADRVVAWNPATSSFEALSTGVNGTVFSLFTHNNGNIFAGGEFTDASGTTALRVARWTPSNSTYRPLGTTRWDAVAGGIDNGAVRSVAVDASNTVYVAGTFTLTANHPQFVARTMGTQWAPLGSNTTIDAAAYSAVPDQIGGVFVTGAFTTAGGTTINDRIARWNGSIWHGLWIDLPGSATVNTVAIPREASDQRVALGFNTTGTAVTSHITVADMTATNDGSAPAAPVIRITGPGTLEGIVNWTTQQRIDFLDLKLNAGEIATLDLRPGKFAFSSTFRPNLLPSITSSHPNSFRLQSGANILITKIKDATGNTTMHVMWAERYLSQDP